MRRVLNYGLVLALPAAHVQAGLNTTISPAHAPQNTVQPVHMPVLEQAGGAKKEADYRNIFLLMADGSVIGNDGRWFKAGRLSSVKPLPGDSTVVPEDLYRTTFTKNLKDWTQIFYQIGLGPRRFRSSEIDRRACNP